MRQVVLTVVGLLMVAPVALATDYQKIDRNLVKEPAYKTGKPRYALLLFGREAKLRVWAVMDGTTLYLDRDGNGDLTGKGECFASRGKCKNITLADPDGKTKYVITSVGGYEEKKPTPREALMVNVTIQGPINYQQYCDVALADSAKKAGVAHFHGPLTAQPVTVSWKVPPGLALTLGDKATDMRMMIGTLDEKAGCWTAVRSHVGEKSAFPASVHPQVDIEWPGPKPGSAPIKQQVSLKQFC